MNARPSLLSAMALLACAGCASPREHYYSLVPDAAPVAARQAAPQRVIAVADVTVPEAVNRPQLVVGTGAHERMLLEQERWIEPLGEDLRRAIAQHLAARLPDERVMIGGERGAAAAALQVYVQVRRFDLSSSGGVRLEAHWLVAGPDGKPLAEDDFTAAGGVAVGGYPALVRAQADAVGSLAARIAAALPPVR